MKINANEVTKICNKNPGRCYFCVQNVDAVSTNLVYLLPDNRNSEGGQFSLHAIQLGGGGFFEMQNCNSLNSKTDWYAWTDVIAGIEIRIMDL